MPANDLKINRLEYCWCCGIRFTDSNGTANREEHHIIPRAAGGTDGPQVSLCDVHHTKAHKISLRLSKEKPYFDLLEGESQDSKKKLLWLASRITNAFALVANDPNKKVLAILSLDAKHQKQIAMLKKVYPHARSREAIYEIALQSLFQKHFT